MSDRQELLQRLLDRATVTDVVNSYATGLDRRNWPLLRSIFTDEIEMEYSSVGMKPGRFPADKWVRNAEVLFAGFGATQHTLSNHAIEFNGDNAHCVAYMRAEHFIEDAPADNRWTIGGYYEVDLIRVGAGWWIHAMALHMTWQTGNAALSNLAIERGRAKLGIVRRR